jgi:cerevisin
MWNLQAISTRVPVGGSNTEDDIYTYTYKQPIGDGVDIYIIDTGVYLQHDEFEGRASWGWTGRGLTQGDYAGHGTHIAGIAAGKLYGVAKKANMIDVKVLSDSNQGTNANAIDGINWVAANVRSTRRPSIACMAWHTPYNQGVNDAAALLSVDGVTAITVAGNEAQDASGFSPASASLVFVTGASDITNVMWPKSNFGPLVNIFAPGVNIFGPWVGGPNIFATASGTSESCGHVAGLAAALLSQNPGLTPGALSDKILSLATQNIITGVPAGTTTNLVYNGVSS